MEKYRPYTLLLICGRPLWEALRDAQQLPANRSGMLTTTTAPLSLISAADSEDGQNPPLSNSKETLLSVELELTKISTLDKSSNKINIEPFVTTISLSILTNNR